MRDTAQYSLDRMPFVDNSITSLDVALADAAQLDACCLQPQCRVTVTKSNDTGARIGRLGNSLSHLVLALSQSLQVVGVDSTTQTLESFRCFCTFMISLCVLEAGSRHSATLQFYWTM